MRTDNKSGGREALLGPGGRPPVKPGQPSAAGGLKPSNKPGQQRDIEMGNSEGDEKQFKKNPNLHLHMLFNTVGLTLAFLIWYIDWFTGGTPPPPNPDDGGGDWSDPSQQQCPPPSYFFTGFIAFMWWCWCVCNYYYEIFKHADFRKKLKIIKKSAVSAELLDKLRKTQPEVKYRLTHCTSMAPASVSLAAISSSCETVAVRSKHSRAASVASNGSDYSPRSRLGVGVLGLGGTQRGGNEMELELDECIDETDPDGSFFSDIQNWTVVKVLIKKEVVYADRDTEDRAKQCKQTLQARATDLGISPEVVECVEFPNMPEADTGDYIYCYLGNSLPRWINPTLFSACAMVLLAWPYCFFLSFKISRKMELVVRKRIKARRVPLVVHSTTLSMPRRIEEADDSGSDSDAGDLGKLTANKATTNASGLSPAPSTAAPSSNASPLMPKAVPTAAQSAPPPLPSGNSACALKKPEEAKKDDKKPDGPAAAPKATAAPADK